ncbi:MAG: PDZ domain-containing protein [Bacteroidota bacterium]
MKHSILCMLFLSVWGNHVLQAQGTQLLRQPTISESSVVFVYANDLWKASREGGDAIRLTSNEGQESLPHFSDDGKMIAFSAQYDGNTDVYVMPVEGGSPQRLTYHPGGDFVQGWTPDGKVLFRSGRTSRPTQTSRLYTVGMDGGLPEAIGVPRAAFGEISPNGRFVAYTPITSWDPEWRNYRGGQAMPIWIVNLRNKKLVRTPQTDRERHLDPVWCGDEVFFLSERDYASNIWAFNMKSEEVRQITTHKQFDVKSLDATEGAIIYEQGGYLHLLNPETGQAEQLNISVKGDMNFARPRWENINGFQLTNPQISPTGKRAIFEHRGEIFTIPKKEGNWRNLTNTPGIAERAPVWSPKGDKVAWFSDASGEYQLVVTDQKGMGEKRSYELPDPTFYFRPAWSPDGNKIAYTDTHYNLWIIDLESGNTEKIDTDGYAHPNRTMNPVWSPDGQWIAYPKLMATQFKAIMAYHVADKKHVQLTDGMADASSPAWDKSGKYLYFLASTNYGLNTGWLDMSSYDPDQTRKPYMILLQKDEASPFLPKSDEEPEEEKDEKKAKGKKDSVVVNIDMEGLARRTLAIDIPTRNYLGLTAAGEGTFFYMEAVPNEQGLVMHRYNLKEQKSTEFSKGVGAAVVSHDRSSVLLRSNGGWVITGTKGKPAPGKGRLKTNLRMKVDPQAEYQQIFKEGWRLQRDFLYVDNVHGAPWDEVWEWYSPWVKHVRHRTDLNYIVDILSGEVAIGHSYVSGGDMPDIDRVAGGLLGADYAVIDGRYQITKIYSGESWNGNDPGPLAIPGLKVKEGDFIMAVDGNELQGSDNLFSFFEETSGRQTMLSIADDASGTNRHDIIVVPVRSENRLRYVDWVEGNRRKVDELSDGKLAYVYVPNTSGPGFTSFNRYYFSQQDKKGVVIDERNNGGGSAADYMIDIMSRRLFGYFNSKAGDKKPWTTPMAGIWGPKVMIINERAGSGGDLLPYMFHAAELGPLIGTRTWGGLVGTWDTPRFIDGGRMVAPRGGFFDVDGEWAVEGEGVAPDIEVIQDPKAVMEGRDPQLERAVQEALNMLKTQEVTHKKEPAAPIRWKRPEK